MALATGPHTVLVFAKLQFLGDFTRWSGTSMIGYTANRNSQLLVVTDDAVGNKTTYWFKVATGVDIWVSYEALEVHIPGLCVRSVEGDATKCT